MKLKFTLFLAITCLPFYMMAINSLSLNEAIHHGYIQLTTKGLNEYTGSSMEMEIKNLHKKGL